jgi:hypothetical protein
LSSFTHAAVSDYVPLHESARLERDIETLMLHAQYPINKRPIATSLVKQAFQKVCRIQALSEKPELCNRVESYLSNKNSYVKHASLTVSTDKQHQDVEINQRSALNSSNIAAKFAGYWQLGEYVGASYGGYASDQQFTPENTYLSFGTDYAQIDLGYKPHWFSPFSQSSMLLSTNAETFATVSLSNPMPLTDWKVSYELFVGELSRSDQIRYQDAYISGNPIITGVHLDFSPFKGFSLGVNRILQSGGRGSQSLEDLLKAFVDPSGADNTGEDLTVDEQFGNQAASVTSRFDFAGTTPFSLYLEYAGEDTSRGSNWRLGNVALSAGLFIPNLFDKLDIRYEMSHWQNGWYAHHVYRDGLSHEARLLGHWAAEQRLRTTNDAGDSVGAFHQIIELAFNATASDRIKLNLSTTNNENYTEFDYQDGYRIALAWLSDWDHHPISLSIVHQQDVFGDEYSSILAKLEW